ncbi:MAG: ABC transporter permease [Ruminococcus sp.]|nr:ABC transporter permease [Ruminococcus sp.]MCM1382138.1 ABC transporter permease [Muribaculaceae bacterium]MCM1479099.1 ABC transporter permease [Muribaculaceae bacterium]
MKRKHIYLILANLLSAIFFLLMTVFFARLKSSLPDQRTAERWAAEEPYSLVSVYTEVNKPMSLNGVFTARVNIEKKLVENSIAAEKENARVWADAFSAAQESITMTAGVSESEVNLTVTGGDFALFHPMDFLYGGFYGSDPLSPDVVVIDEVLAWRLYGSSNIVGKPVLINGKYFFVTGVFRQSEDRNVERVYGDKPRAFMPYAGYDIISDKEAEFICYEACLPNEVSGFGKNILTEAMGLQDNADRVIENSTRYSLKSRFDIIRSFGMRSVSDTPIVYQYWENAARITEDKAALLLAAQALGLVIPICTVTYYIIKLVRNRKKLAKNAINALKDVLHKNTKRRKEKLKEPTTV